MSKKSNFFRYEPRPKTDNQKIYAEAIENNRIIICEGPAGTGKTLLSCYYALKYLLNGEFNKIIITRPAIEACKERIGFIPGNVSEKMQGYLSPILENFKKLLAYDVYTSIEKSHQIEVVPLAFMRGRDFDRCFVLLDEAQNCTLDQFRMILTRITDNSKLIISGDTEQSDLRDEDCCLSSVAKVLKNIDGIESVIMEDRDILRSKFISSILNKLQEIY